MSTKKTIKLTLLTSALAAMMGLTACDKKAEEAPEPETNTDVPMSAEPAENNDPAIVADDLDEVDAQLEATETVGDTEADPATIAVENNSNTDTAATLPEAESVETTEPEQQAPAQ